MPGIKTVGVLARGAVGTAWSAARHPVSTAALTAGLVKGAAEAGVGLVRSTITGRVPQPRSEESGPAPAVSPDTVTEEDVPEPEAVVDAHEIDLPGPDIVLAEVPDPADLPEPIVIEAEDEPHESFHHEPHATTRADTIGHEAGDVLEAEDEAEEALEELSDPQT